MDVNRAVSRLMIMGNRPEMISQTVIIAIASLPYTNPTSDRFIKLTLALAIAHP